MIWRSKPFSVFVIDKVNILATIQKLGNLEISQMSRKSALQYMI
jgi:hypothetical protein